MILIFLSWIYITFTVANLGYWFGKYLRIKTSDFVITLFLGFIPTLIFAGFWSVFGRINWEFHLFLLLLNVLIFVKFRIEIKGLYFAFFEQLNGLNRFLKLSLPVISFLIIAQCATAPILPDNESYYIQTIKWLNEYGLVKGLANLHFFFGQTSGWHILQSVFNFSFIFSNFNDLSGYCLLLGNTFAFLRLNDYFKQKDNLDLIVGLFPLANVLLFSFISAPSPDIAIYTLTFILFYVFVKSTTATLTADFPLISALLLFALLIKLTALPLVLIPMVLLIKNYRILFRTQFRIAIFSVLVLIFFLVKNAILSGYTLYPISEFGRLSLDYTVPQPIAASFGSDSRAAVFHLTADQFNQMNSFEIFVQWLKLPKIDGLFNKLAVLLLLILPIVIHTKSSFRKYWTLYFVMLSGTFIFYFVSAQYRFFLNYILFFSFLLAAAFFYQRKIIFSLLILSIGTSGILLFFPLRMDLFTNNRLFFGSDFKTIYFIFPHGNSKNPLIFELQKKGNLNYYSPMNNDFFWGNGDGNLPCVNTEQLNYFEKHYNFRPQQRGQQLKDGFYSQNTFDHDN